MTTSPDGGRTPAAELELSTLRLRRSGRVLTAEVDAPPHNFMTAAMQRDLLRLARAVQADASVGAVVLTGGVPGRFITHFDIREILDGAEDAPEGLPRALAGAALRGVDVAAGVPGLGPAVEHAAPPGLLAITRFHELAVAVMRSPAVWIAAVNGVCGGGGVELAIHVDVRIAALESASFLLPELLIGLTTTAGGQRLSQLLGPAKALEMLLEGRAYDAAEALEMGLVGRCVPDADLPAAAAELAARYATRNRDTVAAQKRVLNESAGLGLAESLRREGTAQIAGAATAATRAALRRWVEEQDRGDGDSVFLRDPDPWLAGTALDLNPPA